MIAIATIYENSNLGMCEVIHRDKTVFQREAEKSSVLNFANIALGHGKLIEKSEDILGTVVKVKIRNEQRFLKEVKLLLDQQDLGKIGYILGLHSALFVAIDKTSSKPIETAMGYRAVWEGKYIPTGVYMFASIHKPVVEVGKLPKRAIFEDYIYLAQLGKKVQIPVEIYRELIGELVRIYQNPIHLFYSKSTVRSLTLRFVGMIPGILVQHGLKDDVYKVFSAITDLSLKEEVPQKILKTFKSSYNTARELGDL